MNFKSAVQMLPAPGRLVLVIACILAAVVLFLPDPVVKLVKEEHGPFEIASGVIWAVACLLALRVAVRNPSRVRWAGVVMLLWAFLREMDFQKRFTYRSVESLGYYTRPHAPWSEKLIVLAALAPFVVAGLILLVHVFRQWRPALVRREAWLGYLFGGVVLAALTLCLEKLFKLGASEEVLETGVAMMFLLMAWSSRTPSPSPACAGLAHRAESSNRPD